MMPAAWVQEWQQSERLTFQCERGKLSVFSPALYDTGVYG